MSSRFLGLLGALAVVATLAAGLGYVIAQQTVRQAANHPQVEMARDAISKLDAGASPTSVLPARVVDLDSPSDADPYLIVVDRLRRILASSVTIGGQQPLPPDGVFDYVQSHGEDVITWQPEPGVRSAIVVDSFGQGFVVAGRSLKATEELESALSLWALGGWALAMVAIGGVAAFRVRR
ncbi:MAG TPA: hypothetical protein VKT20_10165 [Candidatus Dormibacteraeota bacterium]|nr:hypothetical protein [Candidatus Dormibacteraeota bacterium]